MTYILGISAYYHDSAAALVKDGGVVAAAQEERFSRKKHDSRFPLHAINYVLDEAGISLDEVEYVAYYDKPFLKFERLIETYLAVAPKGFSSFVKAMPVWLSEKLFLKDVLAKELKSIEESFSAEKIMFSEHHLSHAASAFYPSPFEKAVVLTIDGVGEWATTTVAIGDGKKLDIVKEIHFPHSLGLLYSAFTYYLGFKVNSGEYKVMGLAPYGEPKYRDKILNHIIDVKDDGSFRLDQSYFNYISGLTMTNKKFADLFGCERRNPEIDELTQFHMDMAASIQVVLEDVVIKMVRSLSDEFDIPNLCLAGGVALNCVANGKVLRDGSFSNIWIQPAAGDAGGALGAALGAWYLEMGNDRTVMPGDGMQGAYLGPSYTDEDSKRELDALGAVYKQLSYQDMIQMTAGLIQEGNVIGWFQGRMEFGPRALGSRSIIADSRSVEMQKKLNLKIKYRESFRPFAPSVLKDDAVDWFDLDSESPYMLLVANIQDDKKLDVTGQDEFVKGIEKLKIKRSVVPAITHVDYSARVQTVDGKYNPAYYDLINVFKSLTGCPVIVNTSFNIRGEPVVCSPTDAFNCFMGTDMDCLVIGNLMLRKTDQNHEIIRDYKHRYELD